MGAPFNTASAPWSIDKISTAFKIGDVVKLETFQPEIQGGRARRRRAALTIAQKPAVQGALLSLDIASGDVVSLVGGYDFADSEFDRAVQAERQPGSAFKPFVYATALGRGYTAASILHDRPVVMEDGSGKTWRPQNYSRKFLGPITMREALARSVNNATIHLHDRRRRRPRDRARAAARRRARGSSRTSRSRSAPTRVTLLEMTRAYGVFANGGRPVRARFLHKVVDRRGDVLR